MFRKFLYGLSTFGLAFAILLISLLKSATVRYAFGAVLPTPTASSNTKNLQINYDLPYSGKILPDNILWPIKASRDFLWYHLTNNPLKRAEIALLFSDKRLSMSQSLFENKKYNLGFSTLTKSEKYLEVAFQDEEKARKQGMNTSDFLLKYSLASLKHRQVVDQILNLAPEDARPSIIKIQDYSKNAYKLSRDVLNSLNFTSPQNPYDRE